MHFITSPQGHACDPQGRSGAVARNQADFDVIDLVVGGVRQRLAATGSTLMIDSGSAAAVSRAQAVTVGGGTREG
jgi:hypothetical protein